MKGNLAVLVWPNLESLPNVTSLYHTVIVLDTFTQKGVDLKSEVQRYENVLPIQLGVSNFFHGLRNKIIDLTIIDTDDEASARFAFNHAMPVSKCLILPKAFKHLGNNIYFEDEVKVGFTG